MSLSFHYIDAVTPVANTFDSHPYSMNIDPSAATHQGEPYTTTYEAVGPVALAVMSAENFHGYTDRVMAIKSMDKVDEVSPT